MTTPPGQGSNGFQDVIQRFSESFDHALEVPLRAGVDLLNQFRPLFTDKNLKSNI
jgi:hypothetical protein